MAEGKVSTVYKVEDKEILLGVYKRFFWNPLVELIPARIAPNAITIFGQICVVLSVLAALGAVAGNIILYPVSALLLVTYLTADNIDGSHARRTGRCSPLGEFLDHGLDGIASGCILLAAAISFKLEPTWLIFLVAFGGIGWMLTFWAQSRLGTLVIPAIGGIEGVTALAILQFMIFAYGDPTWLRFDTASMNPTTVVVMIGVSWYALVAGAPLLRVWRAGKPIGDILPGVVIGASTIGYVLAGAPALVAGITVTLFSADVVCRFIVLRHEGREARPTRLLHWLIALPLIPAVFLPDLWTAAGWSMIALLVASALYGKNLLRGAALFMGVELREFFHLPAIRF